MAAEFLWSVRASKSTAIKYRDRGIKGNWTVAGSLVQGLTGLRNRDYNCRPPNGRDVRRLKREIIQTRQETDPVATEMF